MTNVDYYGNNFDVAELDIYVTPIKQKHGRIDNGKIVEQPTTRLWLFVERNQREFRLPNGDARAVGFYVDVQDGKPDPARVNNAIAKLRSVWGDLPVRNWSGFSLS